jgi:phosphatidate cytidylyltransferase
MLNRILIALVGIPLLIYILYFGGIPLLIFTNLIIGIGLLEFYKMSKAANKKPNILLGVCAGLSLPNMLYFLEEKNLMFAFALPIVVTIILTTTKRVLKNQIEDASIEVGETVLGIGYVSYLFSHILLISKLPNGGKWLLTAQVLVWVCDSFAYFVGISIGRKFFKNGFSVISPKKSVEGAIGGIIFTVITLFLINWKWNLINGNFVFIKILSTGILVALVAQIGDLGESMYKREFKIKDSSRILGEHGGILDRFDSMLFVIPVVYYVLKFFVI